jgi:hypothetical protein
MTLITSAAVVTTTLGSFPHVLGYLDPGSGSMVLQVLFAGMLSGAFFLKSWLRQFRAGLSSKNKNDKNAS